MRRKTNKYYLLLLLSFVFSYVNNETGWEYVQGTQQCFYMFERVHIDGVDASGDGQPANNYSADCINNPYTCDVIGAFVQRDEVQFDQDFNGDGEIAGSSDVCIGWIYANTDGFTTVPLIGTVPGDSDLAGYMEDNETPIFKIYDHDNDIILPLEIDNVYYNEYLDDVNENGQWDPAVEAEPYTDVDEDGQYSYGESFTDLNDNGIWDIGEPWYDGNNLWDEGEEFTDSNENGQWDEGEFFIDQGNGVYDSPEPFVDSNGNEIWDDASSEEYYQDLNQNGVWDEAIYSELLGWAYNEIFIYNGSLNAYNTFGCNDADACNYDDQATANDGTCLYSPSGDLTYESTVTGNSFEFYWDEGSLDGSPELSYQIIINQGSIEIYNEINVVSPIQLSGLDWSTTYSIDIITTNYEICEPLYTDTSVTTDSMPAPGQVELDTPISGEGEVFLSWNSVNFASTYKIISNQLVVDEISSTIYVDTELAPNSANSYQIQAVNIEGTEGLISESIIGTTLPLSSATLDSVTVGQGELQLNWSMENSQLTYNDENYIFDVYMNDEYLTTRYGTYHAATNLDAGQEYCFYIIPRIELLVDDDYVEFTSGQTEELCGIPEQVSGWFVHIEAELNAWNQELVYDNYNTMGMSPDALDAHDPSEDIPEPPVSGGLDYNVSLSFPHPEWNFGIGGIDVDYFTTDIRELKDLSNKLEIWDASIIASAPGSASLSFDFISNAGNYPIFLNWSNDYTRVYDGDQFDFTYSTPDEREDFKIIVGDQSPETPTSLNVTGESRIMHLSWDLSIPCEDGSVSCSDYGSRYPATSYKVYRSWYEENAPHLIALVGTRHNRISILPSQLYSQDDAAFEITQEPSHGYLEFEYFESFIDSDFNNTYDEGEEFSDCGWDGLCLGDEGYASEDFVDLNNNSQYDEGEEFSDLNLNGIWDENGPDVGEGDGICNIVYYYQANEYFSTGVDSLSYSNGIYDYGEEYIDVNGNEQWDDGEDYIDSRELRIKISDELDSNYDDQGLRTGTIYFYNILASNNAGESTLSMMDSEETAPNIRPIADAGLDQIKYLISSDDDSVSCSFPLDNIYNEDGNEIVDDLGNPVLETTNNSYDPDGLSTEDLFYYWELYDPGNTLEFSPEDQSNFGDVGWWRIGNSEISNITLPETIDMIDDQYLVRLYVQDVSAYYSEPDSSTITVTRDIPEPAIVSSLDAEESLYYIKLFWETSAYDSPGEGSNPPPEGYDGELELADYYVVFRDGVEYQSINSDTLFFVDSGLTPEETYLDVNEDGIYNMGEEFTDENENGVWDSTETHCYYIEAHNGTGTLGPSDEYCYSTGELPVPIILSPSGGEILTSGEETVIEWNIVESNIQFIDTVGVYHSIDAGETWSLKESWSSSEIPVNFIFEIPETDTILFYNKFKVEVLDIGDYGGDSATKQTHSDVTNHLIIIANNELEKTYEAGWNLISSPLELSSLNVWDNFTGDNDNIPNFLLYSQDAEVCGFPQCDNQNFEFQVGEGFYIISQQDALLGLEGNLLDSHVIELGAGWNLIGNPLVAKVLLDSLTVISNGESLSWGSALENELIMPSVHGFDNEEKMHKPQNLLEPFLGYWIHASEPLELLIEPHIYEESLYSQNRDDQFELILYAEEYEPNTAMLDLLWCDMVKIGLSSSAEDGMIYGEDEYDVPIVVNPASYTNMYIDQPEWESSGAETRRFFSDIRLLESSEVTKTWNLTGQLLGNVLSDSISLEWNLNNINMLDEHDITLVAGEAIIDMRENGSAVIVKEYFENMQITIGPLVQDNSCESQGLVTCQDGSCAATIEDCSCESQGLITCEDGTCVELFDDCGDLSNDLIPNEFTISSPYPNPFNPFVKFDFSLPSMSEVYVSVYDINGNHVERLLNGLKPAGYYSVVWDADSHPTGMYFIQFRNEHIVKTMKVVLIK